MAEALRQKKMEVTLVEMGTQVFGPIDPEMASAVAGQLRMHGVDLWLGCSAASIEETGQGLRVKLSSGDTIECTMVLMAIGVRPESRLAKEAGLTIGQRGGIVVNKCMQTSDADIYAVGDAVEVEDFVGGFATFVPLAGPANRQGRIAADNIMEEGKCSYHKTQGTAICKVFDLAVGMTGLSEKVLKRLGRPYEKVYVHPASHANYYPGASPLSLKLIFDPNDGKILGAQAVGSEGVDKRIDVISVAMRAGMSVRDLQDLELCYAPPYGSAKDPVNYAGFVATNVLEGKVKICHWEDMLKAHDGQVLVDVRTPAETEAGTIGAAVNIPVDQLRGRMGELPKDKELLVFCAVGLRGYIACRILQQNGFNCRNLSGGYKTFRAAVENNPVESGPEKKDEKNSGGGQSMPGKEKQDMIKISKHIDACGLQCPGPVMQLKNEIEGIQVGQAVTIATRDPGFVADIPAWCKSTGNELAGLVSESGVIKATIVKRAGQANAPGGLNSNKKTLVVFSSDFDRAMASFVIANGAAAMGSDVTMFFTFWGLNVLRKGNGPAVQKSMVERMLGMMMPKGASKLTLSKMNMCGLGTAMMKGIMRKKSVSSLEELLEKARAAGVKLVACSMSMDIMGIKREELIDGVEIGGVAMYLNEAQAGNVNLFI
jgi:peroxiredoxin family protein/rhodanese-related sulfurtransferase/TusA-related sulfurtransferase